MWLLPGPGFPITSTLSTLQWLLSLHLSKLFTSIGMVPVRSLKRLLRKHSLCRSYTALSRKKVLKSIAQSSIFHFMCRCIKNIAVFANKTLLDILLVGLNNYYTIGEHTSIAYTDLNRKYRNSRGN